MTRLTGSLIPEQSSKTLALKTVRVALAVLLCVLLGYYLYRHQDDLRVVAELPLDLLGVVILMRLIGYMSGIEATRWLLATLGQRILAGNFFLILGLGSILNAIALQGSGYLYKSLYLKERHSLPHKDFFAINVILGVASLCVAGGIATAALLYLQPLDSPRAWILWLGTVLMLFSPAGLILLNTLLQKAAWLHRLKDGHKRWKRMFAHRREMVTAGTLLVTRGLTSFVGFGLLFVALAGGSVRLAQAGVIDALSFILRLVRVMPGNLGLYEWWVAALGEIMGTTLVAGILAALIYRLCGLLAILCSTLIAGVLVQLTKWQKQGHPD